VNNGRGHWADIGMDTLSLAGSLEAKLAAIRAAGFQQVMVSAPDVSSHPGGMDAAVRAVRASGLRVTALQALRDFEGTEGVLREYKLNVAKSMLEMCAAIGSPVLVATSSTIKSSSTDLAVISRDLRRLAMLALPLGIKVAYVAQYRGHAVRDLETALAVAGDAGMPNLGIGIDSFTALAAGSALDELEKVFPETLVLIQLSDFMVAEVASLSELAFAEHLRVFPGEGMHSGQIAHLIRRAAALGFRGAFSLEVFNDDYGQLDPAAVAERARRSAVWISEEVLQRAVPLPSALRLRGLAPG
jgi:sugar phosphate isomerase/epimerase